MSARLQDVRSVVLLIAFMDTADPAIALLRQHIRGQTGIETYAWIHGPKGWTLSASAIARLDLYRAGLKVAICELGLDNCVGIRTGRNVPFLGSLFGMLRGVLFHWPCHSPSDYHVLHQDDLQSL